jgi:hypothetical protein
VIDQPLASIVKEALEGFASGRFATQAEVKRFLESQANYPKDMPNGELRTETVARLMRKVLYAGYLEAPEWNIARRKANHEGIISLETFERVQARRDGNSHLPARKDIHQDFVMRGAVCCVLCAVQPPLYVWLVKRQDGQALCLLFLSAKEMRPVWQDDPPR